MDAELCGSVRCWAAALGAKQLQQGHAQFTRQGEALAVQCQGATLGSNMGLRDSGNAFSVVWHVPDPCIYCLLLSRSCLFRLVRSQEACAPGGSDLFGHFCGGVFDRDSGTPSVGVCRQHLLTG